MGLQTKRNVSSFLFKKKKKVKTFVKPSCSFIQSPVSPALLVKVIANN